jgi:hypothetical protein
MSYLIRVFVDLRVYITECGNPDFSTAGIEGGWYLLSGHDFCNLCA